MCTSNNKLPLQWDDSCGELLLLKRVFLGLLKTVSSDSRNWNSHTWDLFYWYSPYASWMFVCRVFCGHCFAKCMKQKIQWHTTKDSNNKRHMTVQNKSKSHPRRCWNLKSWSSTLRKVTAVLTVLLVIVKRKNQWGHDKWYHVNCCVYKNGWS